MDLASEMLATYLTVCSSEAEYRPWKLGAGIAKFPTQTIYAKPNSMRVIYRPDIGNIEVAVKSVSFAPN